MKWKLNILSFVSAIGEIWKKITYKLSSWKYYYYRRPIKDPSETYPKPTYLFGDLDMLHRRLTWSIGGRHAWLDTHQRPTCPIGDHHAPLETDMPVESYRNFNTFKYSYFLLIFINWSRIHRLPLRNLLQKIFFLLFSPPYTGRLFLAFSTYMYAVILHTPDILHLLLGCI